MKDIKKIYGNFELLHRNKDRDLTKATYTSLNKY